MFSRFSEMRERREGGFTLIELLVVILIIAILAAIAIPVFLNQRKKGWISQMESALKNGATAQESYLTDNDVYSTLEDDLKSQQGWRFAEKVEVVLIGATSGEKWCIQVQHKSFDDTNVEPMAMSSEVTSPRRTATCDAAGDLTDTP